MKKKPYHVVNSKEVHLSPENCLSKAGVKKFIRQVTNSGEVSLFAYGEKDHLLASGKEAVKELIKAIKKYGLRV